MGPVSLLIKPASSACNMNCNYCFYYDLSAKRGQSSFGKMESAVIEEVIKKAMLYADKSISIAFQGGEPTLAGLPFFEKTVEFVHKYNHKKLEVYFALQTNGYDIEEEMVRFFARNKFLLGISVDGTIHTHNRYRKGHHGEDTFLRVMETIDLFEKHGVDFNILTVVNSYTAAAIQKIYKFYKKKGYQYLQFIPCLDPYMETAGKEEFSLTPGAYGDFLCTLFELWYDDFIRGNYVSIRMFDNLVWMMKGYPPESCDMGGRCSRQYVIEADGSVYPCDFYVTEDYSLGNILNTEFVEMDRVREEIRFIEESDIRKQDCLDCSYHFLCKGGCKRHRMMEDKEQFQSNYFCEAYKQFYTYSLPKLQKIINTI